MSQTLHVDASNVEPVHPEHAAALASLGNSIGDTLLQFAFNILIPYALQLAGRDPTLAAQFQAWDVNDPNGPPQFATGQLIRGLKIDKVKRAAVGLVLFRD